jgi:hypothetical protein
VKDFQKIDWNIYNNPPFYQRWLCRDDTLKLASFGDKWLAEVDDQILSLKDQWDIDKGKGHVLDRIGKLLSEKRNGDTDDRYSVRLKLRIILNTNDGSVSSIIKAIKFFYSSEIVHIVPDYPAGLIIEHDGEGEPGLNFNKLLAEIVPAGVSFSTKELVYFLDELCSHDTLETRVRQRHEVTESMAGQIYHNGRILRDGKTVLPTELKTAFHSGAHYHNGITKHNSQYEDESTSYIRLPLTRESGYRDPLALGYGLAMRDFQLSRLFHNGTITRDAVINGSPIARHNGRSPRSISDTVSLFTLGQPAIERFLSSENALVPITAYSSDRFRKPNYHDGKNNHNAMLFHSGRLIDLLSCFQTLSLKDTASGSMRHNGILRRNGSANHSGTGKTFACEKQSINVGFHENESMPVSESHVLSLENNAIELVSRCYKRNNTYKHNGTTLRTSLLSDRLATRMKLAPLRDTVKGRPRHNNSITHNGVESHSFTGIQPVYETLDIGFRYHRFHYERFCAY